MKNRFTTYHRGLSADLGNLPALLAANRIDYVQLKKRTLHTPEHIVVLGTSMYAVYKGKLYGTRPSSDRVSVFSGVATEMLTAAVTLGLYSGKDFQDLQEACDKWQTAENARLTKRRLDMVLAIAGIKLSKTQEAMLVKAVKDPAKAAELESASSIL